MTQAEKFLGDIGNVSDLIHKMHHAVITPDGGWCKTLMAQESTWQRSFNDGSIIFVDGDIIKSSEHCGICGALAKDSDKFNILECTVNTMHLASHWDYEWINCGD